MRPGSEQEPPGGRAGVPRVLELDDKVQREYSGTCHHSWLKGDFQRLHGVTCLLPEVKVQSCLLGDECPPRRAAEKPPPLSSFLYLGVALFPPVPHGI